MKFLLSTGSVKSHRIDDTLHLAHKYGFDGIELILPSVNWEPDLKLMITLCEKYNRTIYNIHAPFFANSLFEYIANRKMLALRSLRKSANIANQLGVKNIIVHPFPAFILKGAIKKMMLEVLTEVIEQTDACISLENLELRKLLVFKLEPYCISNHNDLYNFAKDNNFYLTLDVAHCASKNTSPSLFFEKYHDRINNIHLSDYENYQAHYSLGQGVVDFELFFDTLKRHDYNGCLTLEIDSVDENTISQNCEFIKRTNAKLIAKVSHE